MEQSGQRRTPPTIIIGYVMSGLMVVVGGLVLAGFLVPRVGGSGEGVTIFRTTFGIVVILFGIYRLVSTRTAHLKYMRGD